jgi:hypothetical protein
MKSEMRPIDSITPYEKNPRKNAGAVEAVAKSIAEVGVCPGCGGDGTYRVLFTLAGASPHVSCAVCGDRALILIEFIETPLRTARQPVYGDTDALVRRLNLGASA